MVADFSFPATANVVEDAGARPVFADVSPVTFNMTADALLRRITPKTKAIIAVDVFGNPTGIHEIAQICRERGLPLIEDAACAMGSAERGVRCGRISDLSCFSFHPRKLLTTGEGGAITAQSAEWSAVARCEAEPRCARHARIWTRFRRLRIQLPAVRAAGHYRPSAAAQTRRDRGAAQRGPQRVHRAPGRSRFLAAEHRRRRGVQRSVPGVSRASRRRPRHIDRQIAGRRNRDVHRPYCLSGTTFFRKRYGDVQPVAERLQRETITFPCYAGVDVARVCDAVRPVLTPQGTIGPCNA